MEQKTLIETNPYLRDPGEFRKALITSVASSTAIVLLRKVGGLRKNANPPYIEYGTA